VEWAAAAAEGVAAVVGAVAGVVAPRAGMGHLALYKVTGRVGVFAAVAVCFARFATLAWRRFAAVVVPVALALPV